MSNTDFEQVQKILREAAEGRPEAYGGQRLWEFDIQKFLSAKLHGLPLIAPVPVKSCCGTNESTEGNSAERGEQSNLIKGLRGKVPFDRSQFPPLPWGGNPVAAEDIQLISDWIDNGCPVKLNTYELEVEEPITEAENKNTVSVFSHEIAGNEYPEESATNYQYEPGELKQRMNIDCMSESQLENLRRAFRELYNLNKWPLDGRNYNNLALIHQNHCQHGWERFLPWHRIYLYEFEQALQDHCPGVTMPYWDWTMCQYRPEQPEQGWRIPKSLQAYLTKKSLEFLSKHNIPTEDLKNLVCDPQKRHPTFATQTDFFAAIEKSIGKEYTQGEYRNRFIDALLEANALWYPLRYPGQYKGGTINQVIHYHYPSAHDMEQIMSLRTFRDFGGGSLYNDSYGFIDQNPHNTMHIWTGGMNPKYKGGENQDNIAPEAVDRNKSVNVAGRKFHKLDDLYSQPALGDMFSNLTAAYDPVFWPIHANIDRLWWEWQQQHPESVPADLEAVLTPWSYTVGDTLDIARFGYEYVKNTYLFPVGLEVPVGKFVSKIVNVQSIATNGFVQAEVRLHRVPQLLRSCFIRVFLNLPDANASTPLDHPNYAGYLSVFGHGSCYGGPGHCEPTPLRRREYDLRPRDHNTPRNYRINVTKCAKRLMKDATTLQVTLVVIGADYQEDHELLRLKSVSLNFLD